MAIRKIVARSIGVDVIVAEDLADNSITAAEITNGAVTSAKLASDISITNLAYTGTLTGGTGVVNLGTGQVYKDASGNVGIGTNSPNALLHVSHGTAKIRVGVTADSGYLDISRDGATGYSIYNAAQADPYRGHVWQLGGTERMRIDSSGNVGIGNTTPSSFDATGRNLVVGSGSGNQGMTVYAGTTGYASVNFADGTVGSAAYAGQVSYDHTNNALLFATNTGTERMRIDSSGNLLVGTTSTSGLYNGNPSNPGCKISKTNIQSQSSGDNNIYLSKTSGYTDNTYVSFWIGGSFIGTISTNGSTTAYNTSSDYRLKENIAPMTGALAKVALLKPCTYKWKVDGSDGQGFIAHEIQEVVAGCVVGEKDAVDDEGKPKYQGIDTSFLVATLTAAIQELKAENDTLKQRLDAAGL